ncbi:hypothetical protein ANMWB30_01490 [Arthrobacter sp. MWB30]|nr:hypothetical protein ANMWB30_01490 [Arthrobacter sp. MWB30]
MCKHRKVSSQPRGPGKLPRWVVMPIKATRGHLWPMFDSRMGQK